MKNLGAFALVMAMSASAMAQSASWNITQLSWTDRHEQQFGEFVAAIGQAVEKRQCGRVDTCMKSVANPYYKSDPSGLNYYSDCADLPFYLRSYFAWKNGLPFSVASKVAPSPLNTDNSRDIRYNAQGNVVTERFDVNGRSKVSAFKMLNEIIPNYTFSATYRMLGDKDSDNLFTDFYPAAIDRKGVRPGTVIYDPNGHVAIVYKVSDDGRVFYIDAHPDNSLTMGMFTPKFVRSNPNQGAGFKNFRPLSLVNGRIVGTSNRNLPSFSTVQYYGTNPDPSGDWKKGKFFIGNQPVQNFYEYVRMKLTIGEMHIDPLQDMAQLTDDICVSLQDRVVAVEAARTSGVINKTHPARLPYNIYGTDGEWENFSTPSRDARLKVSFVDLLETTKSSIERFNRRDPAIKYSGGNLARDLYNVYAERAKACQFSYTMSNGQKVLMNLEAARQRLFEMSFDPYHCMELRWGARLPQELAACRDDSNKRAWYDAEKWLRFQVERRYDAKMDYSLYELTGPKPGAGVAAPPDIDIIGFLKSMM